MQKTEVGEQGWEGFVVRVHVHKELTRNVFALKKLEEAFLKVHSDRFYEKSLQSH